MSGVSITRGSQMDTISMEQKDDSREQGAVSDKRLVCIFDSFLLRILDRNPDTINSLVQSASKYTDNVSMHKAHS